MFLFLKIDVGPLYSIGSIKITILSIIFIVSYEDNCFSERDKGRHLTHTNILNEPFFISSKNDFVSSVLSFLFNFGILFTLFMFELIRLSLEFVRKDLPREFIFFALLLLKFVIIGRFIFFIFYKKFFLFYIGVFIYLFILNINF